jgi:hypothetical protein
LNDGLRGNRPNELGRVVEADGAVFDFGSARRGPFDGGGGFLLGLLLGDCRDLTGSGSSACTRQSLDRLRGRGGLTLLSDLSWSELHDLLRLLPSSPGESSLKLVVVNKVLDRWRRGSRFGSRVDGHEAGGVLNMVVFSGFDDSSRAFLLLLCRERKTHSRSAKPSNNAQ